MTNPKRLHADVGAARAKLRRLLRSEGSAFKAATTALAEVLHARLSLYQATTWRQNPAPTLEPDALARRILIQNGGAVPPVDWLRRFIIVAEKTGGGRHGGGS